MTLTPNLGHEYCGPNLPQSQNTMVQIWMLYGRLMPRYKLLNNLNAVWLDADTDAQSDDRGDFNSSPCASYRQAKNTFCTCAKHFSCVWDLGFRKYINDHQTSIYCLFVLILYQIMSKSTIFQSCQDDFLSSCVKPVQTRGKSVLFSATSHSGTSTCTDP